MALESTKEMCRFCFDVLLESLASGPPTDPKHIPAVNCPLFVSYHKKSPDGSYSRLRGCIGNFSDLFLPDGLREYAINAARDHRFAPIQKEELKELQCSVSLLHSFEMAEDLKDWEIGKHGIRLLFANGRRATYLPHVCVRQGWSKQETLEHLARKAGMHYASEKDWKNAKVERYQSSKTELAYAEE